MQVTFLGTRGYIEARTGAHFNHTSTLVAGPGGMIRIDCGEDWRGRCDATRHDALLITHAHIDHAAGLREGSSRPVFATAAAWEAMAGWPIEQRRTIEERQPLQIAGMKIEAFAVQHSARYPAVGYRISDGEAIIFYAPDLVYIHDREAALDGCVAYIGDGATIEQSFVRKDRGSGALTGHTPVRTQLTWCQKLGVPTMYVTHCGSAIVTGGDRAVSRIREYARERQVRVEVATDGMRINLP